MSGLPIGYFGSYRSATAAEVRFSKYETSSLSAISLYSVGSAGERVCNCNVLIAASEPVGHSCYQVFRVE